MNLCMFRTVPLSIIRSSFTVHSATVYVIQVCRQLLSRTRMELQFRPCPARKLCVQCLYDIYHCLSVQRMNSWWWTDELSETRWVSWQNKFVKLVHLFGFITKKVLRHVFNIVRCTPTVAHHIWLVIFLNFTIQCDVCSGQDFGHSCLPNSNYRKKNWHFCNWVSS